MTISKATVVADIFKEVYDTLDNDLTDPRSRTKWIYSSFPDSNIEKVTDYPLIVVPPVNGNWAKLTLKKKYFEAEVVVEVYSSSASQADTLTDEIINSIETSRGDLDALKLKFVNLDSLGTDEATRAGVKVHVRTATFTMKYAFTKSVK